MKCPFCAHLETKVLDSRETVDLLATRRRRECLKCGRRFTTYEKVQQTDLFVVKKDGRRELFDREKVKAGLLKACQKRPVSLDAIEKITDDIEARVRRLKKTEVPSRVVGELIIKKLRKLDKVAYIRFASVYKEFEDLGSFEKEVHALLKEA